jgi:hypothetical protein
MLILFELLINPISDWNLVILTLIQKQSLFMDICHRSCASNVFLQLKITGSEKVNLYGDSFAGGDESISP